MTTTKTIASVDYNGNDWRNILHSRTHIKNTFGLAIFEEKLYWANYGYPGNVFVMNKFNGTEVRQVKLFFFALSFNSSIYYLLRIMSFTYERRREW